MAASTPRPSPTIEATTPKTAASSRTDRKTWRRLAPTMRRSASSRVRWPTVIENVLKIVNPPTKSEMKANTNSAVEKNERPWLIEFDCSWATVWPVTTSVPGGSARAMARSTAALSAPGGEDVDGVVLADLAEHGLGRRQVEDRQGGACQVLGRAEAHDAREGERLRAPGEQDSDPLTDVEVVLGGRAFVHGDLVGAARRVPGDHPQGGELGVGIERDAEGGCTTGADGLAVGGDELGIAAHRTFCVGHARHGAHGAGDGLGTGVRTAPRPPSSR